MAGLAQGAMLISFPGHFFRGMVMRTSILLTHAQLTPRPKRMLKSDTLNVAPVKHIAAAISLIIAFSCHAGQRSC